MRTVSHWRFPQRSFLTRYQTVDWKPGDPLRTCTDFSVSLHPQFSSAVYPGCANPTPSNANVLVDIPSAENNAASSAEIKDETKKQEVIEAEPGLIESTELAPLGEEKVAAGQCESTFSKRVLGLLGWEGHCSSSKPASCRVAS